MIGPREIQVFLAAAEYENFSMAAKKLHMSQPSVSFQIHSLEQQLKVQLFKRIGHRIQLTQAGRDLVPLANEMLNLSYKIDEAMDSRQGEVSGILNIGCTTTPGRYILPVLIGAFRNDYPGVQCIVETVTDRTFMEERLLAKEIHFAILGLPPRNKKLEYWTIMKDELVLIVHANHPWAEREDVRPAELMDTEWIMREENSATRQLILSNLQEQNLDPDELNIAMVLGCPEAIIVGVENGYGISMISRVAAQRSLKFGKIKIVPVHDMPISRDIYMARNPNGSFTRLQERFKEFFSSSDGQCLLLMLSGDPDCLSEE